MMLHIPAVLSPQELKHARQLLTAAPWEDGRVTAGTQSAQVKRNLQLDQQNAIARELATLVQTAIQRNALFFSAALPYRVFTPLFNCYQSGMDFGNHVDNALRHDPFSTQWVRTDISSTLFLNDPDSYDGGELIIEDTYGTHEVKLPAGDLIVYPATSLHRVAPVTRGARLASFFWTQSMIRDDARRALLFDMDQAISALRQRLGDGEETIRLTAVYHNLLRQWSEV